MPRSARGRLERVVDLRQVGAQQRPAAVAVRQPQVLERRDVAEVPDERAHQRRVDALEILLVDAVDQPAGLLADRVQPGRVELCHPCLCPGVALELWTLFRTGHATGCVFTQMCRIFTRKSSIRSRVPYTPLVTRSNGPVCAPNPDAQASRPAVARSASP